jgi:hypothetical protein
MSDTIATDYAALRAARTTLDATAGALSAAARLAGNIDAGHMTRCAVLCEIADTAIFEALSAAAAYLDDPESEASLFPDAPS